MTQMLAEIMEQPRVIGKLLECEYEHIRELVNKVRSRRIRFTVIAARGTSDHAAVFAKYALEAYTGIPVALAAPSVVTLYEARLDLADALVIGISQSGEAADVQAVLDCARESGALTVTITNEEQSSMARQTDNLLLCRAGREKALAATKTYTAELTLLGLFAAQLAGRDDLTAAIEELPAAVECVISARERFEKAVERYTHIDDCLVLGRGLNQSTALEIALKLTETAQVNAKGFSIADFMHGPIVMVRRALPAIVVAPSGRASDQMIEMTRRLSEGGAEVVALSDDERVLELGRTALALPAVRHEIMSPFTAVTAGQLFANYLTVTRGLNPDIVPGLNKVTVTR